MPVRISMTLIFDPVFSLLEFNVTVQSQYSSGAGRFPHSFRSICKGTSTIFPADTIFLYEANLTAKSFDVNPVLRYVT